MWFYEKKMEFPISIKQKNPKLANIILAQYGGAYCIRDDCCFCLIYQRFQRFYLVFIKMIFHLFAVIFYACQYGYLWEKEDSVKFIASQYR